MIIQIGIVFNHFMILIFIILTNIKLNVFKSNFIRLILIKKTLVCSQFFSRFLSKKT